MSFVNRTMFIQKKCEYIQLVKWGEKKKNQFLIDDDFN